MQTDIYLKVIPTAAARVVLIVALVLIAARLPAGDQPGGAGFNAVDGIANEFMVAVGNHGTIVHFFEGEDARHMPSPTERDLLDVHVGSLDFAVSVGPGIVLLWDGVQWRPVIDDDELTPWSEVWASSDQQLVLYGAGGMFYHRGRLVMTATD